MSREREEHELSTADLVSASEKQPIRDTGAHPESLAAVEGLPVEARRRPDEPDRRSDAIPMPMHEEPMHEASARATQGRHQGEPLAALFDTELARDFRVHWSNVQIGFVDDPRRAVQQADELVAQVMKSLAESFARQRAEIEAGMGTGEPASTENLRLALQRYRSFFERLLTL